MCLANDPLTLTHTARTSSKFNLLSLQSPLAKLKKTTELLQKVHSPKEQQLMSEQTRNNNKKNYKKERGGERGDNFALAVINMKTRRF